MAGRFGLVRPGNRRGRHDRSTGPTKPMRTIGRAEVESPCLVPCFSGPRRVAQLGERGPYNSNHEIRPLGKSCTCRGVFLCPWACVGSVESSMAGYGHDLGHRNGHKADYVLTLHAEPMTLWNHFDLPPGRVVPGTTWPEPTRLPRRSKRSTPSKTPRARPSESRPSLTGETSSSRNPSLSFPKSLSAFQTVEAAPTAHWLPNLGAINDAMRRTASGILDFPDAFCS